MVDLDDNLLLRAIMDGTASATGPQFFRDLVKNLSQALATHGAWVTEYLPAQKRLRALAFWLGDDYVDHYEYEIRGTPCEKLLEKKSYLHIPDNVVDLFPHDPDLPEIGAVSYIGFPLLDADRKVLGNIAVVDTRPMPDSFRSLALFRIFAARAAAELMRLNAEAQLQLREKKLRGIFDGAMDAIIELDRDFRISMMNSSARRLLAAPGDVAGKPVPESFLIDADFGRLSELAGRLAGRPSRSRHIWIPGGLTVVATHGEKIRTEATLSRIDAQDAPYYVLILRDVNDRYENEKTIASLKGEAVYLRDEIKAIYDHGEIIGRSRPFKRTMELVAEVAPTDSTVLLHGETGTGKELIARAVHAASGRRDRPLVTVNCAAIPNALMESEFFGHEKGAFTGATQRREGRFSLADGSTIFLDEIGELGMEMQSK
ncbi:MAG TPA: sigma 54-interacting transcriptional regulator, partial [Desulfosarcina sp.]|nr:sigma 54-interacting transcriptional regulator [Desulfosarcina sp.]